MTAWQGRRILLVEDEAMVAMLLEDMLLDLGFSMVRVASRLDDALAVAEQDEFDVAVLDVNLNGVWSYPVADVLKRRNIPFVFTTGYGSVGLDTPHARAATLQKPFQQDALESALYDLLARRN